MWEVMNACVITHNMIIESEREERVVDDKPFDHRRPLAEFDQVQAEFFAFLARHQESRDTHVHTQVHNDLVEQVWERRRNAT